MGELDDSVNSGGNDGAPGQKVRWVPPDHHPAPWWIRHRAKLHALEWGATVFFLAVALYYLWLILFTPPPSPVVDNSPPTREAFRERLRALPSIPPEASWKVAAKPGRWRGIVIHHTDTAGGSPESIDRYHRENNGWENGLGYHFVIGNGSGMPDGEVAVSRRWQEQLDGAHTKRVSDAKRHLFNLTDKTPPNSVLVGIALVGDFEEAMPTPKQLAALRGLLTFLRAEYGIGLAGIVGHGDLMNTKCPGEGTGFFINEVLLALANP